jgi:hypothetical protein
MITTVTLVLGVIATTYEAVVRAFPSIDIKFSIIHKILSWLQVISTSLNSVKQ